MAFRFVKEVHTHIWYIRVQEYATYTAVRMMMSGVLAYEKIFVLPAYIVLVDVKRALREVSVY